MHRAFYQSIRLYAEGDVEAALAAAQSIAGEGEIYAQAARWLEKAAQGGETGTYLDADAFGAFIRGGGNVALYAALEQRVAAAWDKYRPASILEVGPGDGQVIAGALRHTRLSPPPTFDLVEPAANLLPKALERLSEHRLPIKAHSFNGSIQSFADQAAPGSHWDLCQATFSLQNLSTTERVTVLLWLKDHCALLLIAEFDVETDVYPPLSPQRVRMIHDKYLAGVAEYTGHMHPALEERVKQSFLMPMLFGYFRSDARRHTWEQSIRAWSAELEAAGFRSIGRELIYSYWWADAYLMSAQA